MRKGTIRHALFFSFSIIILVSFLSVVLIFFFFEMPKLKEQMVSALEQNCFSIAQSADTEMEQIRAAALSIAYSSLNKDTLLRESKFRKASLTAQDTAELQMLLSAMILPNDNMDQVYLHLPTGEIIGTGIVNSVQTGAVEEQQWYDRVMREPYHNTFMYVGKDDAIGKYSTGFYSKHFISYVMELTDKYMSNGYIEIKRDVEAVLSAAIRYNSVYGEEVYVIDQDGSLIFPIGAPLPEYLADLPAGDLPAETELRVSDGHYIFCSPSQYADFCTVLVISTRDLMLPVFDYMEKIVLIAIITMILAIVISYLLSKRVSLPVREICDEVTAFNLSDPLPPKRLQPDIVELRALYTTFLDMREKLISGMNTQLLLQKQEMQSRMLALQAQMNPHFLYNSLAAIQAMADENMNDEIIEMCQAMSDILRYISSDAEQEVPLRDEIRHVRNYLRCMVTRYQGDLTYAIDIPDQMQDVKVPKLCIQLLVENAIKFSAAIRPPYHIRITAVQDESHYEISIQDNGPGFSREALENLNEKMEEIDASGLLPSLEINGMGLLNVYIRYKLLHSGRIIFRLKNCTPRGACVTMGEYYG